MGIRVLRNHLCPRRRLFTRRRVRTATPAPPLPLTFLRLPLVIKALIDETQQVLHFSILRVESSPLLSPSPPSFPLCVSNSEPLSSISKFRQLSPHSGRCSNAGRLLGTDKATQHLVYVLTKWLARSFETRNAARLGLMGVVVWLCVRERVCVREFVCVSLGGNTWERGSLWLAEETFLMLSFPFKGSGSRV